MSPLDALDTLDTVVAIETPEHIEFRYLVAGPARRAAAYAIDLVVCYGALAVIAIALLLASSASWRDVGSAGGAALGVGLVLLFAAQWLYFLVWEGVTGRSPGKAALGLRVVTWAGRPIGLRAAALRNLLRAADALPLGYGVGLAAMAISSRWSARFQRIGDLVAGTMVVVRERPRAARPLALAPPASPQELATLPDAIALDHDEREAIELFLRRRRTLGRAREHELAGMVAKTIGERIGYSHPDPARLLAIVYDRAITEGRAEAPISSLRPRPGGPRWRSQA